MVCVAGEGQGVLEIWDLVGGGNEPQKKTLKIPQSVRVAELVFRVSSQCKYKIGSVALILQSDTIKVDLMCVRRDLTIAQIGVDFTSGSTYRLLITEWPSSPSEGDEQKMPCVDGGGPPAFLEVLDLTTGDSARTNLEIGPATRVTGLFRQIERNHEPGTFGLFLRCGRNKIKLNDKDTRKLTEVGVDLSSPATVMLLVTEPVDSPTTSPPPNSREKSREKRRGARTNTAESRRVINVEYGEVHDEFATESLDEALRKAIRRNRILRNYDVPGKVESSEESAMIVDVYKGTENEGNEEVEPNRRNEHAYVGLVNQAMTCYLNSLLQALYMTPEFRNALYNWEYVNGSEKDEAKSIPYQLQKLFLNLQTSSRNSIETTSLTKSFGWDSTEAWQQHDIQELCRVMFDALEQKFKNTEQADLINRLYEGKMIDYVKCLECGTEKSREDTFLDIPLPVRPFGSNVAYNSVEEALNAFVQPETLDGTNQYHCDTCNKKCDAHKGLKFTKFPYLLTLHLKRFDFDYHTFHRIKLNDEVTFPDVLNLNSFIRSTENESSPWNEEDAGVKCEDGTTTSDEKFSLEDKCPPSDNGIAASDNPANNDHDDDSGIDLTNNAPSTSSCASNNHDNAKNRGNRAKPGGPYEYELFSIMIHSGSASGGHYYAYIKDFRTGEWLCFNDQNVSPITSDDIQKTYGGGPTRAYYSGVYSSSTNAYMLMYRQIDPVRNTMPMQVKDFPKHLKELLIKMQDNQDTTYRGGFMKVHRLKVFCRRPNETKIDCVRLSCRHDETLADLTGRAYDIFNLSSVVPRDQVRLVTYQESTGMIECSFEGREDETLFFILDDLQDFLVEFREKNEKFKTYMPGGIAFKVMVVDVAKKEIVKGPINERGLVTQTVTEFKTQLGETIGLEPNDIHLIVHNPKSPNARLVTKDDSHLLDEGFGNGYKVFVPTSFDDSSPKAVEDGINEIMEIFGGLISLNIVLPDTSEEVLRELNIPSLDEKLKEKTEEVLLTNGPLKVSPVADEPTTEPGKSETNETPATTRASGTEELPTVWSETTSPPSAQAESEEWHTPEQSNSEDSCLSCSERTLVGEGDASEDDDCPLASIENEFFPTTEQDNWDSKDPSEYYFKATPQPDRALKVLLNQRMSLGTLKKLLESYVGVPMEHFKIYRLRHVQIECTGLTGPMKFINDGDTLTVKLGRALLSCEFKVKLYQLHLDSDAEPYRFLCEWIVSNKATVGQTKKEILAELRDNFFIDIPFERCRLRRKDGKTAGKAFLDDQKFKGLNIWPYEIIVQELPDKETVTDQNDVLVFARRMPTPAAGVGNLQELVLSGNSTAELRQKLSEISEIPEEHLDMAKGKSTLPDDLMLLILQNVLDWNRHSSTLDVASEITLEDGIIIYYRDARIKAHDINTEEAQQDNESKSENRVSKSRILGISSSSRYSPRRERALKIYIDDK